MFGKMDYKQHHYNEIFIQSGTKLPGLCYEQNYSNQHMWCIKTAFVTYQTKICFTSY
jgi:hypothetical protein